MLYVQFNQIFKSMISHLPGSLQSIHTIFLPQICVYTDVKLFENIDIKMTAIDSGTEDLLEQWEHTIYTYQCVGRNHVHRIGATIAYRAYSKRLSRILDVKDRYTDQNAHRHER